MAWQSRHNLVAWDRQRQSRRELNTHLDKHSLVHGFSLFRRPSSSSLKRTSSGSLSADPEAGLLLPTEDGSARKRRKKSIFGLPLVLNTHWIALVQLLVMGLIDATYTAFKVPITFALYPELDIWSVSSIIDIVAGFFFTADMFIKFHVTTPCKSQRGNQQPEVPDGNAVAKNYMLYGGFVVDLVATVPSYIELCADILHNSFHVSLEIMGLLRLLRLVRLLRFIQGVFVLSLGGQLGKKLMGWLPVSSLFMVNVLYAMAVLINLMGSAWLYVAEKEGAATSWLSDVDGVDIHDASSLTKYVSALHFATTTMATVGYGDVSPKNNLERCVAMGIMVTGVIFFSFMINAFGELLSHAGQTARQATLLHNKIQDVETWMSARELPRKLRQETVSYFCNAWVAQADIHEAELLAELPRHLRGKIISELLDPVFNESELMKELDVPARQMLCAAMKPSAILPGHDLCHPGDKAESLWILQKGVITAVGRNGNNEDVLYAPALLGEASLLIDKYPGCAARTCGFRAQEASVVWELQMEDLNSLLFMHPNLKSQMLDGFNQALRKRLQDNPKARWRRAVTKLQQVLHGGGSPSALERQLNEQQAYNSQGSSSDHEREPQDDEDTGESNFQHSMDIMYDEETADAIAEQIGEVVKRELSERVGKLEERRTQSKNSPKASSGPNLQSKKVSFKNERAEPSNLLGQGSGLREPLLTPFKNSNN